MTFDELLGALLGAGLEALAGFDREAALRAGLNPTQVRAWERVHRAYYGSTNAPAQQARARDEAFESGKSLDQLAYIESRIAHVPDQRVRRELRLELLRVPGNFDALKRRAADIVPAPEPKAPTDSLRTSKPVMGKSSLHLRADDDVIADMVAAARAKLSPDAPESPQMAANLIAAFYEGGVTRSVPRPIVGVPLPDFVRVLEHQGDETIFGLDNGTTMTGAQLLPLLLGDTVEFALFHPQSGPVNLYRGSRHANAKQRDLARMTNPVCPFPGCGRGAIHCEAHHVTAWKHGGKTNLNNLVPLCRYHNRVNDDDRQRRKRGHIEIIGGRGIWVSPHDIPAENPYHPYGMMQLLFDD